MASYRIKGLDPAPYKPLFGLSDQELEERGVVRMTVSSADLSLPGEPHGPRYRREGPPAQPRQP